MCADTGVKLMYLPPYLPDLNSTEEFFAELKAFIKRSWSAYEEDTAQEFDMFLEWCIDQVGSRKRSARGHFRHSGWTIEELYDSSAGNCIQHHVSCGCVQVIKMSEYDSLEQYMFIL
jgi:hypothetical protein